MDIDDGYGLNNDDTVQMFCMVNYFRHCKHSRTAIKFFDTLEATYHDIWNTSLPQGTEIAFPISLRNVKQEFSSSFRYFPRKFFVIPLPTAHLCKIIQNLNTI